MTQQRSEAAAGSDTTDLPVSCLKESDTEGLFLLDESLQQAEQGSSHQNTEFMPSDYSLLTQNVR